MSNVPHNDIGQALQWALDAMHNPVTTTADWLARDIDPTQPTAEALLANPAVTLAQLRQAKNVFKTLRILGETAADRRMGVRLYVASIAAALVRFNTRISTQSDAALERGFRDLQEDHRMPGRLRELATAALRVMRNANQNLESDDSPRSMSA